MKWYEYIIIGIAMMGAVHLGLLLRANAKEVKPPVATSDQITIELIATMEDGKVRVYRLVDYQTGTFNSTTCYITVGELHGKTVATECK